MARQIRKKSGTGIYHVMLRGINRQDIFEDDEDYLQMTSILRAQSERYDEKGVRLSPFCTFYAYCLMSNHGHQNPMKAGIAENIDEYPWSSWKEYSSDKCPTSFCSTRTVFARISQTDLMELINTPIEDDGQILDIDTDGYKSVSDSDVKAFLQMSQGIANPLMVQSLEKTRRNEVLRYALSFGAGVRQLSRLTGVSFGVVQKFKKMITRTDPMITKRDEHMLC